MMTNDDERAARQAHGLWWRLFGKLSVLETFNFSRYREPELDARGERVLRYLRDRHRRAARTQFQARLN